MFDIESNNVMLNIFQSDYDVINHHLKIAYNFDTIENAYKFYLLNLLRNDGYADKVQGVHTDYKFDPKMYKSEESNKNQNKSTRKGKKRK